jgi:hypothetical protein
MPMEKDYAQPESSHLSRLDTNALLCARRCWIGSRKGDHQEDSRGTRLPNACGPIFKMMMDKLWRTHGLDEVEKGECGPQLIKC